MLNTIGNLAFNAIGSFISSISPINKTEYLNVINSNILNIDEKPLFNILKGKNLSFITIKKSILSEDSETSIIGMILLLAKYEEYFHRTLIEKFFYFNDINEYPENNGMKWELKVVSNNKINLSDFQKELLDAIKSKIFPNLNFIISQNINFIILDNNNNNESEQT